jgi:hypothetical protein
VESVNPSAVLRASLGWVARKSETDSARVAAFNDAFLAHRFSEARLHRAILRAYNDSLAKAGAR